MSKNPKQPAAQPSDEPVGLLRGIGRDFMAQRRKGIFEQQKDMALSGRQVEFISEAKAVIDKVRKLKVAPTRVEEFEAAVRRQKLTPEFLAAKSRQHKNVQLLLYFVAGVLLVYSVWMMLNRGPFLSLGVLVASAGVAVNAYIHGFRAWQIENRNLIRLQDAIRIPGTYLVL